MGNVDRHPSKRTALLQPRTHDASWLRLVADLRAGLDPFGSSEPFVEPLRGLQTRELRSPELFRQWFGAAFAT